METTTQRLRYVLEVLAPAAAGKKPTLPILQNVVVGQGRAWATNLETAVTVEFPEATDDPVLLPHRQLLSLLRNIPAPTRLSINREGKAVRVAAGGTGAKFPMPEEAGDFPPLGKLQPIGEGQVDADLFLKTATALAEYAAATDTSRPVLQCVCVTLGAPLEMAGADGFRLAWTTIPMALPALNSAPIPFTRLLIPISAVDTLARVWKVMEKRPTVDDQGSSDPTKPDGKFRLAQMAVAKRLATVRFTKTALTFQHGAVTVRVQLADGEFPNYRQLIPADLPHKVTFDAEEGLRAIRSLAEVASGASGIVRLQWSTDRLVFSAQGEDAGAITASVRAHSQGAEARIAFDIRYLLAYLKGKLGVVLLETSAVDSPGRFYHSGSEDVILMPMFVKWGDEPEETQAPASQQKASGGDDPITSEDEGRTVDVATNGTEPAAAASPPTRSKKPRRGK